MTEPAVTDAAVTDAAVTDPAITDPAVNTDPTDLEATMSAVLGTEPTAADPAARPRKVAVWDVPANTRRGGDLRTLLSPATVGATSGFMGVATLQPGEFISEHYHPYSEEFLYVVSGSLQLRVDGEPLDLGSGEGILLPANTRHRLLNVGRVPLFVVFHLGPLAPRPELGHVDTEPYPEPAPPAPAGPAASDASAGPR